MDIKQDPFEGQFTEQDVRALGKDNTEPPVEKATPPAPESGIKSFKQKMGTTLTGEPANKIIIDPQTSDQRIAEEKEKHAVFTFGRFNPPTVGHEKLIHATEKVAAQHHVPAHIIASHSDSSSPKKAIRAKNPVPLAAKVGYLKKVASAKSKVSHSDAEHPSVLDQAKKLHHQGVTHLHMVAGSDRVKEYHDLLHKYNGNHKEALFHFKRIQVHSAGHRDPDAEGTEGMSGTKMRELAHAGKHKEFKAGLPKALHSHAKEIMGHIQAIKEELEIIEAASIQTRVKRSITMKRYKTKIHRAKEIARKRLAGKKQLNRRALKQARQILRKRFAGARGAEYAKLGRQDKIAVDRLLDKRKALVKKVAAKIYTRVKQSEVRRFAAASGGKPQAKIPMPIVSSLEISFKDSIALQEKSLKHNLNTSVIFEVFRRGLQAWSEGMDGTKQQHAFARVNSYIAKGKAYEMDKDLNIGE